MLLLLDVLKVCPCDLGVGGRIHRLHQPLLSEYRPAEPADCTAAAVSGADVQMSNSVCRISSTC